MSGHSIDYESRQAARQAMEIPGQVREAELAFLYRLARRKGNIVEIGALFGRSTSVLVRAAEIFGAKLTTIDPFLKTPKTKTDSSPDVWRGNLNEQGLKPPDLLNMKSHDAAGVYDKEISFVFIDGGHRYETVKQDIEDWLPKVKVGGAVAFHDMYSYSMQGVTKAVCEWWLSEHDTKWKAEGMVDFMIAFRRMA